MRISVVGAGYVGLVSAVCFADYGYDVILSTEDLKKASLINDAKSPFHETDLEAILKRTVQSRKLRAILGREDAVLESDITFIAVGTPSRADGSIDLKFIKETSSNIGKALQKKSSYHLVAVRSTVVPGTTENVVKRAIEKQSTKSAGQDFGLVMQPEFLRQGSAIYDTLNPDRIIIGEHDQRSGDHLLDLYKDFYQERLPPTLRMNLASAEMIKYASNSLLATKISFMNEIANICEKVPGVDVVKVAEGMGLDERIGKRFLHAGAGFGGSCFPKDLNAIVAFAKQQHYKPNILESVLRVNRDQAIHVVELAKKHLRTLKGKKIAILGLSFKPGTDDLREAPSLKIIQEILKQGANVVAYDPVAIENTKKILGDKIRYATSTQSCLEGADATILATEWQEFRQLTPAELRQHMRRPILIDARRIYDPATYGSDLKYSAIGLGPIPKS